MTAFLPFDRKPQKTIASMLCKYSNMVAKPTTGAEWMFQGPVKGGRGAMIVQIVDFRDFMITSEREWADEVGWTSNWGIAISVSHKRRTNEEYAFWHAFTVVMMNAYEGNGLASNEVWLSSDEDGFPTTPFTIEELLPDVISSQAEDVSPTEDVPVESPVEDEEVEEEERLPPPPRMRQPATPDPRLVRRPLKPEVEEEAPEEEEEEAPEEEEEEAPEEEEEEAPKLRLVSFDEEETDEQESDDDEEDEWWDDDEDEWEEEEESPDEDENEEEEISDAITDW